MASSRCVSARASRAVRTLRPTIVAKLLLALLVISWDCTPRMRTSQPPRRRLVTTDELARRRFQLMAVEWVIQMGARIRERREALHLTQRELAALLPGNVGDQQVSKWERGVHKPGDATL